MKHKLMVLLTIIILFGLVTVPVGAVGVQVEKQASEPDCPPLDYDSPLGRDKELLQSLPPECAKVYRNSAGASNGSVMPEAVGGPDDFGYTWDDTVPYSWIDTTAGTNTGLSGYDDATGLISLPFSFKYYENTYSQVYITAYGYLAFTYSDYWDDQQEIPSPSKPNNVIAPYWTPAYIGPGAWVHYQSGGIAPNRYFVVEWHDLSGDLGNLGDDETYRFEVILHENGDIVFQYHTMDINGSAWCWDSGLEDSAGLDGLSYTDFCYLVPSSSTAVRFYRPAPSARVNLDPIQQGEFTQVGAVKSFQITVRNTGEIGADTYDLATSSSWPVTLYAANGVTPLTDTDADTVIDTGPVAQGASKNIVAKFNTPVNALIGDANSATVTATSSLNTAKSKTAGLSMSVPSGFVNVFEDDSDGAMSFMAVSSSGANTYKATADNYFGNGAAVTKLANGNYLYAWSNFTYNGSYYSRDIEYAIFDAKGNLVRVVTKLTNNSSAPASTYDYSPAITVAPNGTVGIAWERYRYNPANSTYNYNIYFVTLNSSGNMLTTPINITNNAVWGTFGNDYNVPRFYSPAIAASDDNRFVISWEKYYYNASGYYYDIWYAVRNTAGANVFSPAAFTGSNRNYNPVLNSLSNGRVILTWQSNTPDYGTPTYGVINSNGLWAKGPTTFSVTDVYDSPDAVLLSNGKVAVSWPTNTGVQLAILNSSYNLESGPTSAVSPSSRVGYSLSATTDTSNRVIMTWHDGATYQNLFYALGDSAASFITQPMIYKHSTSEIYTSYNGQGTAPLIDPVITGNTGVADVELSYFDGSAKSVNSDNNGDYSITVPYGWSGTITPSRTGFTFAPASRTYSNLKVNQTSQNYTASWVGGVKIESDQNIVAVGRPHVGAEVMTYDGFAAGSLNAYVPMLFKDAFGGSYDSALYVQNVDSSDTANITIRFYDSNGVETYSMADTLSPLASKGYWLPSIASLGSSWVGGVKVESDQNIVAVGRPHIGSQVLTYDGFAAGSLNSYVPMLFKDAFGGSYDSALYIQNVDGSNTANVTIRFYDSNGAETHNMVDTISPLASKGYWLPAITQLGSSWVGGVKVESDQNIVAVGRPHIGTQVLAYNGFTAGNLNAFTSMLFKDAFGGNYDSALYIQNVDGSNTANVTIKFYDSNGVETYSMADAISPLASKGYWLPAIASLGSSWVGGVRVESDQNIVAVGRPHIGTQVMAYEGYSAGSLNAYVPMLFKDAFGGSYDSALYIQNVDGSNTANLTINLYDSGGNLACTITDTLAALASKGYWLPALKCD